MNPWLDKVRGLNVARREGVRAPHKPILLLLAIRELLQGNGRIDFDRIEPDIVSLLEEFAPPARTISPQLPWVHLQSDGLWTAHFEARPGKRPGKRDLRGTSGELTPAFAQALNQDPGLVRDVVVTLLGMNFPPGLHEEVLAACGLRIDLAASMEAGLGITDSGRIRASNFREDVFAAYGYTCAVSGMRMSFGPRSFGLDAAHIKWHAHGGPDELRNGLALAPTVHRLFDRGAWTLDDEYRLRVSASFDGSGPVVEALMARHGQSIRLPALTKDRPDRDFIRWHREEKAGGVFRSPWRD